MQTGIIEYMILLINSIFHNNSITVPDKDFNWSEFYILCKKHDVANLVCYALDSVKNDIAPEIMKIFEEERNIDIVLDATQKYEAEVLFEEFEKNNLRYMPLKGYIIKDLYPFSDMRKMCDIDILISRDIHTEYEQILLQNGYTKQDESNHEYIYSKGNLINIELHKSIVPTYDNDLYSYYGDGWKLAQKCKDGSCEYKMSDEDFLVFMITHFSKHYRKAGIGIRHIIDIYLFKKQFAEQLDIDYINKQLKRLNLYKFYENINMLIDFLFESGAPTPLVTDMMNYIMNCGSYGNDENNAVNTTIKLQSKYKSILGMKLYNRFKLLFPPVSVMRKKYKILDKYVWLYPITLIIRMFKGIFCSHGTAKQILTKIESNDMREVQKSAEHFKAVGLDMSKI